jgi:hypothetical protein
VGKLADRFERLSGGQQDVVLTLGLIAVAAGPAIAAMRTLYSVGSAAFAIGRTALAAAGASAATSAAGAAAGGAGAGAAAAGGAGAGAAAAKGASRLGRFARVGGRLAGRAAGPLAALVEGYGEYTRYRDTGLTTRNVLYTASRAASIVPGVDKLRDYADSLADRLGYKGGNASAPAEAHRDPMPLEVGLHEAGTKAQSIQEALLEKSAARGVGSEEATAATREATAATRELIRVLQERGFHFDAGERARAMRD